MKRYQQQNGDLMTEHPEGQWVKYEDLSPTSTCSARFTIEEIRAYFAGWKLAANTSRDMPSYAVLHNALLMLEDNQDGIASHRIRQNVKGDSQSPDQQIMNTQENSQRDSVDVHRLVRQLRERAGNGLATCQSGNGNPKIVIEFRDLRECQECYETLVHLWGGEYSVPNTTDQQPQVCCIFLFENNLLTIFTIQFILTP